MDNETPKKRPPVSPKKRRSFTPQSVTPSKKRRGHCMDRHQITWSQARRRYSRVEHISAEHEGSQLDLFKVPLEETSNALTNENIILNRQVLSLRRELRRAGTDAPYIALATCRVDQQRDKFRIVAQGAAMTGQQRQNAAQQAQITAQQTQITAQQTQIIAQQTQSTTQQTQITAPESTMADLQSALANLASQLEALKTNSEDQQTEITTLKSEITTLKSTVVEQQTEITTLESTVAEQQTEITTLKSTIVMGSGLYEKKNQNTTGKTDSTTPLTLFDPQNHLLSFTHRTTLMM